MRFLLDTNVISELRRADKADSYVRDWSRTCQPHDLCCSSISILELEMGALRTARHDLRQGRMLHEWLHERVIPGFADRILPFEWVDALRCAALHVPDPRPDRDAMIGATALVHDLTLVTRNVRDFRPMGVPILDPWQPQA